MIKKLLSWLYIPSRPNNVITRNAESFAKLAKRVEAQQEHEKRELAKLFKD